MKSIVVLYKSKYGSTKKYATWISEMLLCDCIEIKQAKIEEIINYDIIILGGGLYACKMAGVSFLKKNYDKLKEKTLIAFAVGVSPYDEKVLKAVREANFGGDLDKVQCFYCRGNWDEAKMSWKDRTLCHILKKSIEKKQRQGLQPLEIGLLSDTQFEWIDKEYLNPIFDYVNNLRI